MKKHTNFKSGPTLPLVPSLPPDCPWRNQYETIVIPKVQHEFLMQRVLNARTARFKILLSYLLWGGERFQNKDLLLPCDLIANFFGHAKSYNLNTSKLLQEFFDDVLAQIPGAVLDIGAHDWLGHRCRRVKAFSLGALQSEFEALGRKNGRFLRAKDMPAGSMVYLHNGRVFSRCRAQKTLKHRDASISAQSIPAHPVSQKVLDTMQRVPELVFARHVGRCFARAAAEVENIKDSAVRRSQEAILRRIDIDPKPRYSHSLKDRTHRVFDNGHIPNLKRDIRKVFTAEWPEADLSCAQLAIASAIWGMNKTLAFLASGMDVWKELLTPAHGLSGAHKQQIKRAIKTAMYSMLYLRKEKKAAKALEEELLAIGCGISASRFLSHWIFQELAEASQTQAKRLRDGYGLADAFGQVHYACGGRAPSSVMAQVNQSYELYLLEPVIDFVNAKDADGRFLVNPDEMRIVLWSHDGFNIAVRRKCRIQAYQRKLSKLVRDRATQAGIPVRLEWR
jgi:hypothetical protein